jgi:hypothetical protein
MTVEGLIHNLTAFADFYERASADIDRAVPFEKPHAVGARDANADHLQRLFRATPGIDRVRAYVLARYGEDLTIGTARRLLGDLIRARKLTVEAAGALSLEAAMDRLDGNGGTETREVRPIPLAATRNEHPLPGGTQPERMFDNDLNPFRIMAAFAQEMGSAYRRWVQGGELLPDHQRMTIYVRWQEAREAALRLAGTAGLALDVIDRDVRAADAAFTAIHQAIAAGDRSADTGGVDAASVRLYELGLLTDEAWRKNYSWNPPVDDPTGAGVKNSGKAPVAKRSTERGEGRAKLIAALTKHHRYADAGALITEPVNNNELARLAGVDKSTASDFFKKEFGDHARYKLLCQDPARLVAALKLLNGEFSPQNLHLYGRRPADEDDRDDE